MTNAKYYIKCDDCKQPIGLTDSLHESACGGVCYVCQVKRVASLPQEERLTVLRRQADALIANDTLVVMTAWEQHCTAMTDGKHVPVSQGGSATYTAPTARRYYRCEVCYHERDLEYETNA